MNVKFSVIVMYARSLTLTSSAGGAWILKNEQRNRDIAAKKRANLYKWNIGETNNYYEDIYIPPYSNTH